MKFARMRFPGKPTKQKCWIGCYGGHYSIVTVFFEKPYRDTDGTYPLDLNHKIIAGTFDKDSFNEWFGTDIQSTETEITSVEEYKLTAIWNEYNEIVGLHTTVDQ